MKSEATSFSLVHNFTPSNTDRQYEHGKKNWATDYKTKYCTMQSIPHKWTPKMAPICGVSGGNDQCRIQISITQISFPPISQHTDLQILQRHWNTTKRKTLQVIRKLNWSTAEMHVCQEPRSKINPCIQTQGKLVHVNIYKIKL